MYSSKIESILQRIFLAMVFAVSAMFAARAVAQETSESSLSNTFSIIADGADGATAKLFLGVRIPQQSKLSRYWIGVDGVPADDLLRSQLELPEGQGLVITQVVENSAAAKAGLRQHDVLLTAGGQSLGQISDLAAVIQNSQEQSFSLKLIRRARQIVIDVKPERRPDSETGETCPRISDLEDRLFFERVYLELLGTAASESHIKAFLEDQRSDKREQLVNRLLRSSQSAKKSCTACHAGINSSATKLLQSAFQSYVHWPTASDTVNRDNTAATANEFIPHFESLAIDVMQPAAVIAPPNDPPDDLKILISRTGKQLAKVSVTRGEQSWETTVDQLAELPEEVRGHVEQLLNVSTTRALCNWWINARSMQRQDVPSGLKSDPNNTKESAAVPPKPADVAARLFEKLEKLKSEHDELRTSLQELLDSLPKEHRENE